jgi:aarF domain-containing kinase
MERLSGVPLTDLASIRAVTSKDPEGVLISALNTWFASVLGADTFHADVHAGGSQRLCLRSCVDISGCL